MLVCFPVNVYQSFVTQFFYYQLAKVDHRHEVSYFLSFCFLQTNFTCTTWLWEAETERGKQHSLIFEIICAGKEEC